MVSAIPVAPLHRELNALLPSGLDAFAREFRAFRRARAFADAASLIRGILFYAVSDWSPEDAAGAMRAAGVPLSPSLLHERLCAAEALLSVLLGVTLAGGVEAQSGERRLRAIDATCIAGPGAKNADLRIHALADLASRAG